MSSTCWQITFHPQSEPSYAFEDFLSEIFEVTSQNYRSQGFVEYIGYTSSTFDEAKMLEFAASLGLSLPPYDVSELKSENWLKDYVIKFAPFEVEDFMIYGIHETAAPQTKKIPLRIYAATAFGSDHQTTRSCLKAICDLYHRGFLPERILDVGTGSGILSLAAAKLWQKNCSITAIDIDEEAVWVTRQNALDNRLQDHFTIEVSNGYDSEIVRAHAPYDLIFANILARPLIEMAPDLYQSLKPGGHCILSGFVDDQVDWVVGAHQKQGLKLLKMFEFENWRAAIMEK